MAYGKHGKGPHMGHKDSAMKMGHSPMENQNKGYAKQERKDLMNDNPVARDASGGRSWMSKHSQSALRMGHSPAEMGHNSPAEMHGGIHPVATAKALAGAAIKTAKKVKKAVTESKPYKDVFEGGFERKRKLRVARGGAKPAKLTLKSK